VNKKYAQRVIFMQNPTKDKPAKRELVVSSAHLAAGGSPGLSELEYGLILASQAFMRWIVRCMAAAGVGNLSPTEVMILHTVRHRDRPKTVADICLVLGIADTHVATYALRKLESAELVSAARIQKEKAIRITDHGLAALTRYSEIREKLLVSAVQVSSLEEESLSDVASQLRVLSGFYDQAARAAATF
jgi:predicted MarR family transcription regulator